jgi:DNA-binding MarR family transcriptional regulator
VKAWKFILAALAVFLAGAATGVTAANFRAKSLLQQELARRGSLPPFVWSRFELFRRAEKRAQITAEQRERIAAHIRAAQGNLRKLWEPLSPAAQQEFARLRELILGELAPEQRPQFEEWLKEQLPSKRSGDRKHGSEGKPSPERKSEERER